MTKSVSVDQVTRRRISKTGLTAYDLSNACDGYVLYSPMHDANLTLLIDMEGNEVHRWNHDCQPGNYGYFLPNGNLFFNAKIYEEPWSLTPPYSLFKGGALREMDWDANILWEHRDPYHHHEGRRLPHGGAIYLTFEILSDQEAARVKGGGPPMERMLCDVVVEIDAQGKKLWEWHAKEHLDINIDKIPDTTTRWEWTHLNAAFYIDADHVLMSSRQLSKLLIVERSTGKIVNRFGPGPFYGQHDPHLLDNGNILLFDNGCYREGGGSITYSQIIEYDMQTRETVWKYQDQLNLNFYSPFISGVDIIPNGNYLITEGSTGRMFQITRDGEIVWEFINPHFGVNGVGQTWNCVQEAKFYTKDQIPALA